MEEVIGLSSEQVTVVIGFIGALGSAIRLYINNKKLKKTNIKLSEFIMNDFKLFSEIESVVRDIYKHTSATRFLILTANNGKENFTFASAIYEQHKPSSGTMTGAIRRYNNIHIDKHYRDMLKDSELKGYIKVVTHKMPDSILKDIYEMEGVVHSQIIFLKRFNINKNQDRVFFCSVATNKIDGFNDKDQTVIHNYSGLLRTIFSRWF